jgi:hypothetical protein
MSVLLLQNDWGYVLIAAELLAKLRKMTGRAAVQCSLLEAALAILTTADSRLSLTDPKAVAQVCGVWSTWLTDGPAMLLVTGAIVIWALHLHSASGTHNVLILLFGMNQVTLSGNSQQKVQLVCGSCCKLNV